MSIHLTYTQCKQIAANCEGYAMHWSEVVDSLSEQQEWLYLHGSSLELHDIQAIQQGGCASGAHMDAVTYYKAAKTMSEHGDEVLDYIVQQTGELPKPDDAVSWSGMAVFYLSYAIELWCAQHDLDGVDWQ